MLLSSVLLAGLFGCGNAAQDAADRYVASGSRISTAICTCGLGYDTTEECLAENTFEFDEACVVDAMDQLDDPQFAADCYDGILVTYESCMAALPCSDPLAYANGLTVCLQALTVGTSTCYEGVSINC